MRSKTWCIHYAGIVGEGGRRNVTCKADVEYDSVRGRAKPYKWACTEPTLQCSKREYPTAEQVRAAEEKSERVWQDIRTARAAIVARLSGEPGQCDVECPACGASLAGALHGNGHVHAACSTDGCLMWME